VYQTMWVAQRVPSRTWAFILPLAITALLVLLPPGAHAASTAVVQATCTMASGAPSVTLSLSESPNGGSLNPATLPCDGQSHPITVDQNVLLTASEPPPGSNDRQEFPSDFSFVQFQVGTSSSYTWPFTNYDEKLNTLAISIGGQGSTDAGLTWTFTGFLDASPSATICTLSPPQGVTSASDSTGCWSDYGEPIKAPGAPSGAAPGVRFLNATASKIGPITSGANTYTTQYYKQVQDTFTVVPNAAPSFDPGLQWVITGTFLGAGGHTICTIFSSISPTSYMAFADYDTSVSFPSIAQGPPGPTRWFAGTVATPDLTEPGITYDGNYYKQASESFSISISDGSTGFSNPVLLGTSLGVGTNWPLGPVPQGYWLDFGSSWSANSPLAGSSALQRWSSRNATGTAKAGGTVVVPYYHQFSETLSYMIVGGGAPTKPPSVSYHAFGRLTVAPLNLTASPYWMDSGQSFSLVAPPGSAAERWASSNASYQVSEGASFPILLYHQYSLELYYVILGGGSGYSPPTLTFSNFSRVVTTGLTQASVAYWANAGTNWNATSTLAGSGAEEKWESNQVDSGVVSGSISRPLEYYHQYFDVFAYSVTGGGSGYSAPIVAFIQFGAEAEGTQGWVDAGSMFSFTEPLMGSTASERWDSGNGTGLATQSALINQTYHHQYAYSLSYSAISPTVPSGNPWLNFYALGRPESLPLSPSSAVVWLDSGSGWSVIPEFSVSGQTERWSTQQPTSGNATSPVTIDYAFYNQYYITLGYTVLGGGSPGAPSVSYATYASHTSSQLTNSSIGIWANAGSRWALPPLLPGSSDQERWYLQGPDTETVIASQNYQASYQHEFFLQTTPNTAAGGVIANETLWYNSGVGVSLNASAVPGWKFAYWNGVGSGAYNGTQAAISFPLAGPATETAEFYPGLSIIVSGGGQVHYMAKGVNGSAPSGHNVVFVPLGSNVTLKAVPSIFDIVFEGWSGAAKGKASQTTVAIDSPTTVSASFGLDYSDIDVIGGTIPVVVILAVYVFVVRRRAAKRA